MRTISIVIAAYQAQDWLADCLDSVFSQILPEAWQMQVLLGIDGCPATLSYAKHIKHADLTVIALRRNRGTYVTFNTLMRLAEGELVCRFDADDVMQKNYLTRHIETLEAGVDMTMSWSIYTDVNLKATSRVMAHEFYHPKNGLNRRGCEGNFIIRRQVWERLGGFRAWRCGADTDFFRRLRYAGFQFEIIEKYLYLRRTHRGSLTAHPSSNFQSPMRLKVQMLNNQYRELYLRGKQSLRVEAEYESCYEHL